MEQDCRFETKKSCIGAIQDFGAEGGTRISFHQKNVDQQQKIQSNKTIAKQESSAILQKIKQSEKIAVVVGIVVDCGGNCGEKISSLDTSVYLHVSQ